MSSRSQVLKIGLAQVTSSDSLEENLKMVWNLLSSLQENPEIIFFPENVFYFCVNREKKFEGFSLEDSFFKELQIFCNEKNTAIHWGGVGIKEGEHCFNASVLQRPQKPIEVSYKKIHLFDINLEKLVLKESRQYARGDELQTFLQRDWVFGQSICYDLRFAELYWGYAKVPVDVTLVPSAFTKQTGKAHWHSLLKARAIESQCFFVAAAQGGDSTGQKSRHSCYGHSLVVSPWGEILLDMDQESPAIKTLCLDRREIEDTRKKIPMREHRTLFQKGF